MNNDKELTSVKVDDDDNNNGTGSDKKEIEEKLNDDELRVAFDEQLY